ncbi:flagellar protein FlgN [Pantoea coffeiphila]|uniref:Flagellar protein FlgN n=1 Tax=Pantoea coffeiphila TaxID=1465635 RepID=A0A2S9IHU1_9GAMM|nr:flagellar protein FlgN [Pantoea coffeiphila]PRD17339.1 flagellar protein FlgN [Pantoea coffeiphila]
MSNPTERVKTLLHDLQQDNDRYQRLLALLEQQREAMLACHAARSEEIGGELMTVYPLLQASARRRAETLVGFSLSPDGRGLLALFSRLPTALRERATGWWAQLEQQAQRCQQLNQHNGLLLSSQQEMLGSLLHNDPQDFLYSR